MNSLKMKVFVPSYGAGLASYIENDEILNEKKAFVYIELLLNDMNLYIPESKVEKYRIREISSRDDIEKGMMIIRQQPLFIEKKWGKRYRMNNEKIDSGNLIEICEVLRDLYYLFSRGIMPPGEKIILARAESMLASEISLAFDISMAEAFAKIRNLSE